MCTMYNGNMHALMKNYRGEFTLIEVSRKLAVTNKTIINRLAVPVKNGFVIPILVKERIRSYELSEFTRDHEKELNTFIDMRINQLREEGAKEEIDLAPALKQYYMRHMADGTFVSWLAFDGDKIIGTSGMSFVEKPPYFGCPSGKIGLLSSMFTNPDYRRKGIARELLSRVVEAAREYRCGTVQITASDMGVKLYADFGFVHNENFMQYKL